MNTLFLFWLAFSLSITEKQYSVPDKMMFCDIEVTIKEGAKQKLRSYQKKLYENPKYFNQAVDRADTFLPFVEEALKDGGVPDDLKYIAIQESNLFADATSSSNAIGFWQFKEEVAKENGLRISEYIDERKHIFRSSQAAVKFLRRSNKDFGHWLYAIICYYEGQTGAIPYTDPLLYGTKKMTLDENSHWYLLKTIAYKLAYEEALKLTIQPQTWLQPYMVMGPVTVEELASRNNITTEQLLKWNKWMLTYEIPEGEMCTYYIPRTDLYIGHTPDPTKLAIIAAKNTPPAPEPVLLASTSIVPQATRPITTLHTETPPSSIFTSAEAPTKPPVIQYMPIDLTSKEALPVSALTDGTYALIDIEDDLYYGLLAKENGFSAEYVIYDGTMLLADLALANHTRYSDILQWNGLITGEEPTKGTVLYLQKGSNLQFHVVKAGETMQKIAVKHHVSAKKLFKKNEISPKDGHIYIGQRLYLKEMRPKNEKLVILKNKYWLTQMGTPLPPEKISTPTTPTPPTIKPTTPPVTSNSTVKTTPPATSTPTVKTTPSSVPPRPVTTSPTNTPTVTTPPKTVPVVEESDEPFVDTKPVTPPPKTTPTVTKVEEEPPFPMTSRWLDHKVVAGETLWRISVKYQTKVDIIKKVNNLTSDALYPGQVLKIFTTQPE